MRGLTAAGVYGIAVLLLRYVILVVVSVGDATQPRLAGIEANRQAFRESLLEYARVVSVLAVGVVTVVFLSARDFLDLWLESDEVLQGGAVETLQVLLLGILPDLMTVVTVIGLRAVNKYSWYAAQNLVEGALNLALSIALAPRYGVMGVALGTAIPSLFMKVLVQPVYCCRLFGIPLLHYARVVLLLPLLPAAILVVPLLLLPPLPPATSYVELALRVLAFLVLFAGLSFVVSIGPTGRRRLRALLPRARSEAT
jgi:O-antigen/teichoic acid export membrane protein